MPDDGPVARVRTNARNLDGYVKSVVDHIRAQSNPMSGRGFPVEDQVAQLLVLTTRIATSVARGLDDLADALEKQK
jgi:hypothetical protein